MTTINPYLDTKGELREWKRLYRLEANARAQAKKAMIFFATYVRDYSHDPMVVWEAKRFLDAWGTE